MAGHDLKTVASILGHSDKHMTMRYARATAESRQAAVLSLEDEDFRVHAESIKTSAPPAVARSSP